MKAFLRIAAAFGAAAALAAALPLVAQEQTDVGISAAPGERILSFDVVAVIGPDSSIKIVETILYDFGSEQRHGIYRDIPVKYKTDFGNQSLKIADISVTDEAGNAHQFETSGEGRYERIRIGDPDAYVTGTKTYRISYTADRALGYFDGHDELYWNATGNEWTVPIERARATLVLPARIKDTDAQSACYVGPFGSAERCAGPLLASGNSIDALVFEASRALGPGEGLTFAVGFPKGLVSEPSAAESALDVVLDNLILLLPVAVLAFMWRHWHMKGRDPKGRGTIVPEYDAPDGLEPFEVSAVMNEGLRSQDISAGIIYLASRGHIEISRKDVDVRFLPDRVEYEFKRTSSAGNLLSPIDEALIKAVFEGGETVKLEDLKLKFYKKIPALKKKAIEAVIEKGYYSSDPAKVRNRYLLFAAPFLVLIWIFGGTGILNTAAALSIVASGFIVGAFAMFMPKATEKGSRAREAILGLKDYLQIAEKDRLKFHNAPEKSPKLFESLLPYAMVLGVEESWAKEFSDMYMDPPSWYRGTPGTHFNSVALASDIRSFNTAVAANMASAPGSSSGSGGGGFSGGGGGGGGGGSW